MPHSQVAPWCSPSHPCSCAQHRARTAGVLLKWRHGLTYRSFNTWKAQIGQTKLRQRHAFELLLRIANQALGKAFSKWREVIRLEKHVLERELEHHAVDGGAGTQSLEEVRCARARGVAGVWVSIMLPAPLLTTAGAREAKQAVAGHHRHAVGPARIPAAVG